MTTMDVLLIILFLLFCYVGYLRGFVFELFNILTLLIAPMIAFAVYIYPTRFLISTFNWGARLAHDFSFLLILLPAALAIFLLGLHFDRLVKGSDYEKINRIGGLFIGTVTSLLLCWLLIFMLSFSPFRNDVEYEPPLAPVVNGLRNMTPVIETIFMPVMPSEIKGKARETLEMSKTKEQRYENKKKKGY